MIERHWFRTAAGPAVLLSDGSVIAAPYPSDEIREAIEERERLYDDLMATSGGVAAREIRTRSEQHDTPAWRQYKAGRGVVCERDEAIATLLADCVGESDAGYANALREANELQAASTAAWKRWVSLRDARVQATPGYTPDGPKPKETP